MHPEADQGFGWALSQTGIDRHAPLRVLDLGGQNVNGTVHHWFTHPDTVVTTLDLENADVIADATTWNPDRLFDIVIATEVFEHIRDWPAVIETARKALDPDGPGIFLATCASDARPPHGATGAALPAPGEWYRNIPREELAETLAGVFARSQVRYQHPPGDAYAWACIHSRLADITVIIPTITPRQRMLGRAVDSVRAQTLPPAQILVMSDDNREGPAVIRNRLLEDVNTGWVAFLDDDDTFMPEHLATLYGAAVETGADVVWPWFIVSGGTDPFPMHRGRQWDPEDPHQIPITALVRTEALRAVGGFRTISEGPTDRDGNRCGEDFDLWLRLSAAGYRFHHVDAVTWTWHHGRHNTSGLPSRW